ncbi:MAG: YigZ family protein [Clostridia bacterium]|nr:YigZ family protein [Clostridia bacterium]
MEEFKTINKNEKAQIIEKKSKFIAHIFYIETIERAEEYIKNVKKEYYDAKHNVFAYVIETGNRRNCSKI